MKQDETNNLIRLIYGLVILMVSYFLLPKIIVWFLPFIIAMIISTFAEPLIDYMEKKLKMNRKLSSLVALLLVICIIGSLLTWLITNLIGQLVELSKIFPSLYETSMSYITSFLGNIEGVFSRISPQWISFIENLMAQIGQEINTFLGTVVQSATRTTIDIAKNLPGAVVFVIVLLMSTYFLMADRPRIMKSIKQFIPFRIQEKITMVKEDLLDALAGYFRALMILMGITFVELSVGLTIAGVPYSLLLAFVIAIIDALPVLGSGLILLPWALASLIMQNYRLALFLIIIQCVIFAVRQLLEPRIVGKQIGLHPLATLTAMYAGLKIIGVFGLIIGPITALILKNLYLSGIFGKLLKKAEAKKQNKKESI